MTEYVRKSTWVRYFGSKRVCLTYPPLAKPVTEYILWRADDTGDVVKKQQYDAAALPEKIHDSAYERADWLRAKKEPR